MNGKKVVGIFVTKESDSLCKTAFGVAEQGARGGYNRVVNENAA